MDTIGSSSDKTAPLAIPFRLTLFTLILSTPKDLFLSGYIFWKKNSIINQC